jgi:predicted hotdog family 3-hydroxylacyl-ACP dehydratase
MGELGTTLAATSNRRTLRRYLVFLRSVRRLLVTASIVPSSQILVTLTKEALGSSETSVLNKSHAV